MESEWKVSVVKYSIRDRVPFFEAEAGFQAGIEIEH